MARRARQAALVFVAAFAACAEGKVATYTPPPPGDFGSAGDSDLPNICERGFHQLDQCLDETCADATRADSELCACWLGNHQYPARVFGGADGCYDWLPPVVARVVAALHCDCEFRAIAERWSAGACDPATDTFPTVEFVELPRTSYAETPGDWPTYLTAEGSPCTSDSDCASFTCCEPACVSADTGVICLAYECPVVQAPFHAWCGCVDGACRFFHHCAVDEDPGGDFP